MKASLLLTATLCGCVIDPLVFKTKAERRNLDCYRLPEVEAAARFPGQVPPPPAKEIAGPTTDVLVCSKRYLDTGERKARDEAILSSLSQQVNELTESAGALAPAGARWHVDAFYPSVPVAQKIAVAARTTLAERGLTVSDRVPLLAAGDVSVLAAMLPTEAYQTGCARAFATEVLTGDDVFLGLMIVDPKETMLHGGLCMRGVWRWLP